MAKPRFRRVNIDGQSLYKTETRIADAAILPGTAIIINATNEFANTAVVTGRMYIAGVGEHQGLGIMDPIPLGDSVVGNYLEENREFALRFAASTAVKKDDPITVTTGGLFKLGVEGTDIIIGYSQETVTLDAGAQDFIRVRARYFAPEAA